MQTTYHHLLFLPNSKELATKTQEAFMLYSLLSNIGDAIKSEASIRKNNAVPQRLLECDFYRQAVKTPAISSVISAMRRNYDLCNLSIKEFGGSHFICRLNIGEIRLSLTFDHETFINITATQSLDIEQMRGVIENAILNSFSIKYGYFLNVKLDCFCVCQTWLHTILDSVSECYQAGTITSVSFIDVPSSKFNKYIIFLVIYDGVTSFVKVRCYSSDLPRIFPHTPNAAELPRPPKNAIERFILND